MRRSLRIGMLSLLTLTAAFGTGTSQAKASGNRLDRFVESGSFSGGLGVNINFPPRMTQKIPRSVWFRLVRGDLLWQIETSKVVTTGDNTIASLLTSREPFGSAADPRLLQSIVCKAAVQPSVIDPEPTRHQPRGRTGGIYGFRQGSRQTLRTRRNMGNLERA